jgi:hypothetical protein
MLSGIPAVPQVAVPEQGFVLLQHWPPVSAVKPHLLVALSQATTWHTLPDGQFVKFDDVQQPACVFAANRHVPDGVASLQLAVWHVDARLLQLMHPLPHEVVPSATHVVPSQL